MRIGNWLMTPGPLGIEPFKVSAGFIKMVADSGSFGIVQPIPLTPEILEKAGFVVEGTGSVKKYTKLDFEGTGLVTDAEDGVVSVWVQIWSSWEYIDHKARLYLHQLQNLYFALTGEELNIEL